MNILAVEVEQIKRYERARFEFRLGTNAIVGPNGAGKSTILEAIGFALFDHLPYKKADFVRRGAKTGTVRVTFESSLDGRAYMVVRTTGTQYHVYDPATKTKLAEQKLDVLAWLRQHLGLEPETELGDFFRTTVGVPQGTLTAIFLETGAGRKAVFDQILRVEAYRAASDRLLETTRHLQASLLEAERELSGHQGRLARLPELEDQVRMLEAELASVQQRHDATRRELTGWQARLLDFDQGLAALALARQLVGEQTTHRDYALRSQETAERQAQEAVAAHGELSSLAAAVAAHEEATRALAELEQQRQERDRQQLRRSEIVRRLDEATVGLRGLQEQLARLMTEAREREELQPRVALQVTQEELVRSLRARLAERDRLVAALATLATELATRRARLAEAQAELAALEADAMAPARVTALQSELAATEARARELTEQELALRTLEQERQRQAADQSRATAELARQREQLARCTAALPLAARLAEIEQEGHALRDQQRDLQHDLEKLRLAASGFRGSVCPILDLECPHLHGEAAEAYFRKQIPPKEAKVATLELALVATRQAFKQAKDAATQAEQHEAARARVAELEREVAALLALAEQQQTQAMALEAVRPARAACETERTRLQAELAIALQGAQRYARREATCERLHDLTAEVQLREAQEQRDAVALEALAELPRELSAAEAELQALGDPRTRSEAIARALEARPRLEAEAAKLEREAEAARGELVAAEQQLAPHAGLEERLAAMTTQREAHEAAHRRALALAPLAEQRPARTAALEAAQLALAESTRALAAAVEARDRQEAAYDAAEHQSLKETVERVKAEVIRQGESLGLLGRQLAGLQAEQAVMAQVQQELAGAIAARDRLLAQVAFVEFARATLKEAGPHITEAYLASISLEADRLFREITGMHHTHLRWTNDYEILLEESGRDRPFQSLSGGEQMAAALAVRLALLKETSGIDVAFFDEPTTNMDEDRRGNLAQQLGQIKSFKQLFVITHDDTFEQFTDHTVRPQEQDSTKV